MKRIRIAWIEVFVAFFLVSFPLGGVAAAGRQAKASKPVPSAASAVPAVNNPLPAGNATLPATGPVRADENALELIADFQMIQGEMARIDKASGTVEIPVSLGELRQRSAGKLARLSEWMKAHGVGDDWRYNAQAKQFESPVRTTNRDPGVPAEAGTVPGTPPAVEKKP